MDNLPPNDSRQYQQQQPPYQQQQYQQPQYQQQQYQQQPQQYQQQQYQQPQQSPYQGQMAVPIPPKDWLITILLCSFLGSMGIHRFYTGRIVSGIFQFLTAGGFGIWTLIDLIMIITGEFKDQYGRPLYHVEVRGGNKNWVTAALLCLFLGGWGAHRFYTGRIVSGIFQILTFGGFGIWTLVDLIMIYTDNFTDVNNMPLSRPSVAGNLQ